MHSFTVEDPPSGLPVLCDLIFSGTRSYSQVDSFKATLDKIEIGVYTPNHERAKIIQRI